MDALLLLLLTLIFISVLALKRDLPVCLVLLFGGLFFGLMNGSSFEQVILWTIEGMGKIFSSFALIILSGIVIMMLLAEQDLLEVIVATVSGRVHNTRITACLLGYLLSVPTTCCLTTYMMVAPVVSHLEPDTIRSKDLLYLTAIGSIISYVLIFPTPATIPLLTTFAPDYPAVWFNAISIPISLFLVVLVLFATDRVFKTGKISTEPGGEQTNDKRSIPIARDQYIRAWAPFCVILLMIPVGLFVLHLSHVSLMQVIMLAGLITALFLAPTSIRKKGFSNGAKLAGLILFDFSAAGALGTVIVRSGLADNCIQIFIPILPDILIPFVIAAVFATAQGSRVVTAVITTEILSGTSIVHTIHPVPLILMVAAGTCCIPYFTDPYFWLVKKTTGDDIRTVLYKYTLPLAGFSIILCIIALFLSYGVFPSP